MSRKKIIFYLFFISAIIYTFVYGISIATSSIEKDKFNLVEHNDSYVSMVVFNISNEMLYMNKQHHANIKKLQHILIKSLKLEKNKVILNEIGMINLKLFLYENFKKEIYKNLRIFFQFIKNNFYYLNEIINEEKRIYNLSPVDYLVDDTLLELLKKVMNSDKKKNSIYLEKLHQFKNIMKCVDISISMNLENGKNPIILLMNVDENTNQISIKVDNKLFLEDLNNIRKKESLYNDKLQILQNIVNPVKTNNLILRIPKNMKFPLNYFRNLCVNNNYKAASENWISYFYNHNETLCHVETCGSGDCFFLTLEYLLSQNGVTTDNIFINENVKESEFIEWYVQNVKPSNQKKFNVVDLRYITTYYIIKYFPGYSDENNINESYINEKLDLLINLEYTNYYLKKESIYEMMQYKNEGYHINGKPLLSTISDFLYNFSPLTNFSSYNNNRNNDDDSHDDYDEDEYDNNDNDNNNNNSINNNDNDNNNNNSINNNDNDNNNNNSINNNDNDSNNNNGINNDDNDNNNNSSINNDDNDNNNNDSGNNNSSNDVDKNNNYIGSHLSSSSSVENYLDNDPCSPPENVDSCNNKDSSLYNDNIQCESISSEQKKIESDDIQNENILEDDEIKKTIYMTINNSPQISNVEEYDELNEKKEEIEDSIGKLKSKEMEEDSNFIISMSDNINENIKKKNIKQGIMNTELESNITEDPLKLQSFQLNKIEEMNEIVSSNEKDTVILNKNINIIEKNVHNDPKSIKVQRQNYENDYEDITENIDDFGYRMYELIFFKIVSLSDNGLTIDKLRKMDKKNLRKLKGLNSKVKVIGSHVFMERIAEGNILPFYNLDNIKNKLNNPFSNKKYANEDLHVIVIKTTFNKNIKRKSDGIITKSLLLRHEGDSISYWSVKNNKYHFTSDNKVIQTITVQEKASALFYERTRTGQIHWGDEIDYDAFQKMFNIGLITFLNNRTQFFFSKDTFKEYALYFLIYFYSDIHFEPGIHIIAKGNKASFHSAYEQKKIPHSFLQIVRG